MAKTITFQGSPLTLSGDQPKVGSPAPDFCVTAQDMSSVKLADFKGKIKLISVFPSLDTPVCDLQVKEFNKRSAALSKDVAVIGISKDLPFAQKRFCSEHDITNTILSDYKTSSFGRGYGLLIEGLELLARAVVIIGKDDLIGYVQVAPELTKPLDYAAALAALGAIAR